MKLTKNTRIKITKFEIFLLELCEKIIELLTFRPIFNYIENLIFRRKLQLKSKYEKKINQIERLNAGIKLILGLVRIQQCHGRLLRFIKN